MRTLKQKLSRYPLVYSPLKRVKSILFPAAEAVPTPAVPPVFSRIPMPVFTVVEVGRLLFFKRLLDIAKGVEGDVVECGVGGGRSFLYLALLCREEEKGRQLWGFDSFEGFPEPTGEDKSDRNPRKGEARYDIRGVYALLEEAKFDAVYLRSKVTLVKGFFEESLKKYSGQGIALLHIDADLYRSYRGVLEQLYDRVNPGGVIVFDEYMDGITNLNFPGAKTAVDEFFAGRPDTLFRDKGYGKYYVVKAGGGAR